MAGKFDVEELERTWKWSEGDPEELFVLEEEIASGSFGSVYKVRSIDSRHQFASPYASLGRFLPSECRSVELCGSISSLGAKHECQVCLCASRFQARWRSSRPDFSIVNGLSRPQLLNAHHQHQLGERKLPDKLFSWLSPFDSQDALGSPDLLEYVSNHTY